jgi:O-antigen/teichoic acid export membrane protein
MNKVSNIAKNTSYLTLALILQKLLSFTYFTLLARYLGPENLGKYYAAISFTTIFGILIDLGFINFITRETAKKQENAQTLLSQIMGLKVPLAMITFILVWITAFILNPHDPLIRNLIMISALSMVLDSFSTTFFAVIRGFHTLKYESVASVIFQLIVLGLGCTALFQNWDLRLNLSVLVVASVFNFAYSYIILEKRLHVRLRLIFERRALMEIFSVSAPFAVFGILQRFYTYFDTVLLSYLAGDKAVGVYQVSFKIIFALQFLPLAFTASLYPALSSYWLHNQDQLRKTFSRAMNYLIIISLPIVVGILVLADKVIKLFKSGYEDALWPLRLAMLALFFIFVNFPLGSLLNACDRQRRNTINMAIVTVVSIVLNCLLIPKWQATGASFTVLVTNILMFVLGTIAARDLLPHYSAKSNWLTFGRSLLAALLMGAIIWMGRTHFNFFILVALGAVVYSLSLFALKGFTKDDIKSIAKSFRL